MPEGNEMIERNVAPREYVHGLGAIKVTGERVHRFGKRVAVLGGRRALQVVMEHGLKESLEAAGVVPEILMPFQGYCTPRQIESYREAAGEVRPDVILGTGGGSALDCAKAVAASLILPVVCVPTSPAQCAATSPLSIVYTDSGEWMGTFRLPACPECVIVDDKLMVDAPLRMFRSGIADALAKPYEIRLAVESGLGDGVVRAALAVAMQILNELRDKAEPLIRMLERNKQGGLAFSGTDFWPILADVIDASVFLPGVVSGAAGDKARLSVAHAVHNALTRFESVHALFHGEIVAYAIAVQLALEGRYDELEDFARLMKRIHLVSNLEAMGLNSPDMVDVAVAQVLTRLEGLETPFDCSTKTVREALLRAHNVMSRSSRNDD